MNSIFNRNLSTFKTRLPHLYSIHEQTIHLFSASLQPVPYENCTILVSRTGLPSLKEKGILVHSSYNPENEAFKAMQAAELQEKDAAVFFGFGLGYGPLAFTKIFPQKTLILIEPDIIRVLWTFQYVDFSPVFNHSSLICLFSAGHGDCINVLEQTGIQNCRFIKHDHFSIHAKQYFTALAELIERNKQKKEINDNTLEKFGKLWLKNSIKNACAVEYTDSIQSLKNIYAQNRAFILAAGPGLEVVLPLLPVIQKKAVIICVDTALRSCLNAGIEPDFIILVDPQYWNARHIDGLKAPTSTLITEIAAYPSVFRFPCRKICLCSSLYPFGQYLESFFGEFGKLAAGGSVATTAWDFAQWIGCTEIYFAGLDLSYPDKKTHITGSTFEERATRNAVRLNPVETYSTASLFSAPALFEKNYDNTPVLTDSRMKLYAWWFESKCASSPQINTFTVSKKSMIIPGISYFPLEHFTAFENMERKEVSDLYTEKKQKVHRLLRNLLVNVNNASLRIHKGIQLSTQASKILFEIDKQRDLLIKLQEIDQFISTSELKDTLSLIFPSKKKLDELYEESGLNKNSEVTFLTSIHQSKILYTEILHGLKILKDLLEKTLELH